MGHRSHLEGSPPHWSHLRQSQHPNQNGSNTPEGLLCARLYAWAADKLKEAQGSAMSFKGLKAVYTHKEPSGSSALAQATKPPPTNSSATSVWSPPTISSCCHHCGIICHHYMPNSVLSSNHYVLLLMFSGSLWVISCNDSYFFITKATLFPQ